MLSDIFIDGAGVSVSLSIFLSPKKVVKTAWLVSE